MFDEFRTDHETGMRFAPIRWSTVSCGEQASIVLEVGGVDPELAAWRSRFRRLVAVDPTVVDGLRRLVEELEFSMPGAGDTQIGRIDMRGRAVGHGRINMAARDIHITES